MKNYLNIMQSAVKLAAKYQATKINLNQIVEVRLLKKVGVWIYYNESGEERHLFIDEKFLEND